MPFSDYTVFVRQQPLAARACGSADRPDRRPIDPIVILQVERKGVTEFYADGPTASFFAVATLFDMTDDRTQSTQESDSSSLALSSALTGTIISSIFYLKDPAKDGQTGAFFVFSDLNVRSEGSYRLRFDLFGIHAASVSHVTHCTTNTFTVYSAKRFPGMTNSTELSKTFSDQGLKIRIRKDIRVSKKLRLSESTSTKTSKPPQSSTSAVTTFDKTPSFSDSYVSQTNPSYIPTFSHAAAQLPRYEGLHSASNDRGTAFARPDSHAKGNITSSAQQAPFPSDPWDKTRSNVNNTARSTSVQSLLSANTLLHTESGSYITTPVQAVPTSQPYTSFDGHPNQSLHNNAFSSRRFATPEPSNRSLQSSPFCIPPQTAKLPSFGEIFSNIHQPATLPSMGTDNYIQTSSDDPRRRDFPTFPPSDRHWRGR